MTVFPKAFSLDPLSIDFQLDGTQAPIPEDLKGALKRLKTGKISPEIGIIQVFSNQKYRNLKLFKNDSEDSQNYEWRLEANTITTIFDVTISGLGFLEESAYKSKLRLKAGTPFHNSHLEWDKSQLISRLQQQGYPGAKIVDVRLVYNGKDSLSIEFKIEKGRPCRIAEVRITPQRFLSLFSNLIEPGSICDKNQIEDALERERAHLLNKGFYNAIVQFEGLTYTTDKERAVVRINLEPGLRTTLQVYNSTNGALLNDDQSLKSAISNFDISFYSEEDIKQQILNFYLNRGYARAQITGPRKISNEPNSLILRFDATIGSKYKISEIHFENELPFDKSVAIESMELEKSWFFIKKPYVYNNLKKYQNSLTSLLADYGYLNAKVSPPNISFKPVNHEAVLTFSFDKGPKFIVKDFSLIGVPKDFSINQKPLRKILSAGSSISQQKITDFRENLRQQLLDSGYFFSDVDIRTETLSEHLETVPTKIIVMITSDKITRIRDITAQGSLYEKEQRIIKETHLNQGDIFTPYKVDRSRLRLLQHDLFSSVSIEPSQMSVINPSQEFVDLVVKTQGRTGYTLGLSPSYGSYRGYSFSADYVKNSLTTKGLKFTANASISQNKQQKQSKATKSLLGYKLSAGVSEPLLKVRSWQSPFDSLITGSLELTDNEISSHRIVRTLSLGIQWKPAFFDWIWNMSARLSSESSTIIADVIEPIQVLDRPNILINEIITEVGLDTRNEKDWPTRGGKFEVSSQHPRFGFYSDVQYNRFSIDNEVFYPLGFGFSGAFLFGGSKITAIKNQKQETISAPGNRRKRLMGPSQIRGFPDDDLPLGPLMWLDLTPGNSLTPRHNCTRSVAGIGATNLMYIKHELRYRFPKNIKGFGFGLVGFIDSGTAFFTNSEQDQIRSALLSISKDGNTSSKYNQCLITNAYLIDNDDVKLKPNLVLSDYAKAAYVSGGFGIRVITPNVLSVALDWGLPIYDPGSRVKDCIPSKDKYTWNGPGEPTCILRSSRDKFFGKNLPFPGAIHFRIDASL